MIKEYLQVEWGMPEGLINGIIEDIESSKELYGEPDEDKITDILVNNWDLSLGGAKIIAKYIKNAL